ncbi:pentapeptide repeat-containing protein (plasmid) [Rhodococcus ruber]|uniref:pentapeptide repeat-containing protein n=1 Tax=Rhodococcus ruber TaxID=1830 RepID=UPI00265AD6CC|nr:pentapeptide repeat-containing protein [Rhodococcus ruber]WKK14840.1 pentapeptide repeat-containing protein [Rhodococcus ruber]
MGEDDEVTTSSESGGTDVTATDASRTTVEVNPARRILIAIGLATLLVVGLLGVTGWATIQHGWSLGRPWWYGLQLRYVATPIAAFTAAIVAITTAWWTVRSTRAISAAEHRRWETDRRSENARRTIERQDAIERTLRDRFHELVKLLASEDLRARAGAAYAIAALADDWQTHYRNEPDRARAEQQVCIDVLISQLRDRMPDDDVAYDHMVAFKHSVQGIFGSRLGSSSYGSQPGAWSSYSFSFDGCTFHDLDLGGCSFTGEKASFHGAQFIGNTWFFGARFETESASFDNAQFLDRAVFTGVRTTGLATWIGAHFAEDAWFGKAHFASGVKFWSAHFTGETHFERAHFLGLAEFEGAHFTAETMFDRAHFTGDADFARAHFTGDADFERARFSRAGFEGAHFTAETTFDRAHFAGDATFRDAHFANPRVSLESAKFAAGPLWLGDTYFDVPLAEFPRCEECTGLRSRQVAAKESRGDSC